MKNMITI